MLEATHNTALASEAKQSGDARAEGLDCFVASLLAMTGVNA
jgi:hypothetical protein